MIWNPFRKRIWKETKREFLRDILEHNDSFDFSTYKAYAVYYEDVISGKTKIVEEWIRNT